MPSVFISFRIGDERVGRERLCRALVKRLGRQEVFISGGQIPGDVEFAPPLMRQAAECPLMLVLIGPGWLHAHDETGRRLLGWKEDRVRREITAALHAGNRVIPVLLGDAVMLPGDDELPDEIAVLGNLQFLRIGRARNDPGIKRCVNDVAAAVAALDARGDHHNRFSLIERSADREHSGQQDARVAGGGVALNIGRDARSVHVVGGDDNRRITHKKGSGGLVATATWLGSRATSHPRVAASVLAVVSLAAAGGIWAAGGSATRSNGSPRILPTPPSSAPAAPLGPGTPGLRVVTCAWDEGDVWTQWSLTGQKITAFPVGVPSDIIPSPGGTGDDSLCVRFGMILGSRIMRTTGIFGLSPDQKHVAVWANLDGDNQLNNAQDAAGQFAGYVPAGLNFSSGFTPSYSLFTDASGPRPQGTEARLDQLVSFNPKTGELWWQDQRSGHMYSNTVPPTHPVDRGVGLPYAFTQDGQPMPLPFYDSPDGSRRAVLVYRTGRGASVALGASTSMTSACLQNAVAHGGTSNLPAGFCGSAYADTASLRCRTVAGWTDDNTLACITEPGAGYIDSSTPTAISLLSIDSSARVTASVQLVASSAEASPEDALVTPDGKEIFYTLGGPDTSSINLIPARATAGAKATVLDAQAGNSGAASIIGFLRPDGEPVT